MPHCADTGAPAKLIRLFSIRPVLVLFCSDKSAKIKQISTRRTNMGERLSSMLDMGGNIKIVLPEFHQTIMKHGRINIHGRARIINNFKRKGKKLQVHPVTHKRIAHEALSPTRMFHRAPDGHITVTRRRNEAGRDPECKAAMVCFGHQHPAHRWSLTSFGFWVWFCVLPRLRLVKSAEQNLVRSGVWWRTLHRWRQWLVHFIHSAITCWYHAHWLLWQTL